MPFGVHIHPPSERAPSGARSSFAPRGAHGRFAWKGGVVTPVGARPGLFEAFGLLSPLASLDDVTVGEQGRLECDPPLLSSSGQELEIHREVLELLLLSVLHDRPR